MRLERKVNVSVDGHALRICDNRRMHDGRYIHALVANMRAVVAAIMVVNMMLMMPEVAAVAIMTIVTAMIMVLVMMFMILVFVMVLMIMVFLMMLVTMTVIVRQRGKRQRQ